MAKLYHIVYTTAEDDTPVLVETHFTHHKAHVRMGCLCNFRGNDNVGKIYTIVEEEYTPDWAWQDSGIEQGFY